MRLTPDPTRLEIERPATRAARLGDVAFAVRHHLPTFRQLGRFGQRVTAGLVGMTMMTLAVAAQSRSVSVPWPVEPTAADVFQQANRDAHRIPTGQVYVPNPGIVAGMAQGGRSIPLSRMANGHSEVFAALGGENASFLSSAELEAQARATSSDEVSRVRNSRVMQLKAPYTIDMDGRIGGGRLPTGPIFIKDDKGNLVATMRPTQPRFTEDALKKQFRDVDEAFDFQPYGAPISTWIVNDVAQPGREEEMFRFDFFRVSEGWVHAQATPRDMSDNPRATVPNSGTGLPGISGLMYAPLAGLNRRASIGFRMAGLDGVASADFLTDPARWDQNEFEIALRTALEDGLTAGKQTGMKFKVMQRNNGVSIRVNYDGKGTVPTATEVATGFMCFMASRSR